MFTGGTIWILDPWPHVSNQRALAAADPAVSFVSSVGGLQRESSSACPFEAKRTSTE